MYFTCYLVKILTFSAQFLQQLINLNQPMRPRIQVCSWLLRKCRNTNTFWTQLWNTANKMESKFKYCCFFACLWMSICAYFCRYMSISIWYNCNIFDYANTFYNFVYKVIRKSTSNQHDLDFESTTFLVEIQNFSSSFEYYIIPLPPLII